VLGYVSRDYEGVIKALASGAMNAEEMITSKIRLDRVVEDGFSLLLNDKDKHVKILVDCRSK
jgi:threonine dehydrogenase-like Zn-dependent dehydrogenase